MTARKANRYAAELTGSSWSVGPSASFGTIREARAWAESHGTTADSCEVTTRDGRVVARHRRDPNGDGTRWFKAQT